MYEGRGKEPKHRKTSKRFDLIWPPKVVPFRFEQGWGEGIPAEGEGLARGTAEDVHGGFQRDGQMICPYGAERSPAT